MKLGHQVRTNEQEETKNLEKLILPSVTLVCVDDLDITGALNMVKGVTLGINFADVKFFASDQKITLIEDAIADHIGVSLIAVPPIKSIKSYDEFIFNDLINFISTEFCMIVQTDGHPVRSKAWRKEFLDYDYIGAPWTWVSSLPDPRESFEHCPVGRCVGNSGFSIRSKKLMEALREYEYDFDENGPEDEYVCRTIGDELKAKGIKFAPVELASMFSVENTLYKGQFGFHGKATQELNKKLGVFK